MAAPGRRTLAPNARLTRTLHELIAAVAYAVQERPGVVTAALRDRDTRREMQQLVGDLFSLMEVVFDEHGETFPLPTGVQEVE